MRIAEHILPHTQTHTGSPMRACACIIHTLDTRLTCPTHAAAPHMHICRMNARALAARLTQRRHSLTRPHNIRTHTQRLLFMCTWRGSTSVRPIVTSKKAREDDANRQCAHFSVRVGGGHWSADCAHTRCTNVRRHREDSSSAVLYVCLSVISGR